MRRYIRYSIPELLLCLVMSVGLSVSVFQGFYLSTSLVGNLPLLTAVCAALLILLFLAGYDRRSSLIGVLIAIAAVIGTVMLLRANDMPLFTAEEARTARLRISIKPAQSGDLYRAGTTVIFRWSPRFRL